MTEMLNKTMLDSWRKYWGTNDDDIPDPPPAFVRGFNAAVEALGQVVAELVDLMERSDMEEFGEDCQPVTNGEWFPAIERAKAAIG